MQCSHRPLAGLRVWGAAKKRKRGIKDREGEWGDKWGREKSGAVGNTEGESLSLILILDLWGQKPLNES